MVKVYPGGEVLLEPGVFGWALLWYADGYQAQVSGAKVVVKDGQEQIKFYLMPFQATIKRFGIDVKKDLDRSGHVYKWYPKEMVKSLNTYDPSRRIFFCLLNWDGKESDATNWFKGIEQADEIRKLRGNIRGLKAYNETLREENMVMKTNVQKYIKDNIEGVIKPLVPAFKSLISPDEKN